MVVKCHIKGIVIELPSLMKNGILMIEPDMHSSDGTSAGVSIKQSNTTHILSCPERLLQQKKPKVMDLKLNKHFEGLAHRVWEWYLCVYIKIQERRL